MGGELLRLAPAPQFISLSALDAAITDKLASHKSAPHGALRHHLFLPRLNHRNRRGKKVRPSF